MSDDKSLQQAAKAKLSRCSFCSKSQTNVKVLVAGPGIFICNECVAMCNTVIEKSSKAAAKSKASKSKKPKTHNPMAYLEAIDTDQLKRGLVNEERVLTDVGNQQQMVVDVLRTRKVSWAEIGEALGVSRQAVWRRFGTADADG